MATSNLSFRDINITFKKHPVTDDLVVSKDGAAVKQAIANLLLTNKGERLFNPSYGADLRSLLFEPMSYATAGMIKQNIKYAVGTFEPRIVIRSMECTPNEDDNGFDVEMTYKIRGSSTPPVNVEFFLNRTR
jgi:phage baseplate assembly protein W